MKNMTMLELMLIILLILVGVCISFTISTVAIMIFWNFIICWLIPTVPQISFLKAALVTLVISTLTFTFKSK